MLLNKKISKMKIIEPDSESSDEEIKKPINKVISKKNNKSDLESSDEEIKKPIKKVIK
jgi:hypothetical protein